MTGDEDVSRIFLQIFVQRTTHTPSANPDLDESRKDQ